MNAKAAIAALQPLEGHHILILTSAEPHGFVHGQPCLRVQHLPPDQRQPGQGNIILWNGNFTQDGLQTGGTFCAKDIRSITWNSDTIAHIRTRQPVTISIIKLWKLS